MNNLDEHAFSFQIRFTPKLVFISLSDLFFFFFNIFN